MRVQMGRVVVGWTLDAAMQAVAWQALAGAQSASVLQSSLLTTGAHSLQPQSFGGSPPGPVPGPDEATA
jgi:hypothetical protein